jgi:hypothetical protein|tara:strand:+ start:6470 stop:7459 length:990 start_codon:yes stop_codon:yes gene_type:complete
MAFLDNSGDIILDAVLTDAGRKRLAQGDGSFRVVKFAFGDDEIDYESFHGGHPSGSAYFDLEILQTPIFEAFTNNTSTMKTKLISLTNNNLLFLPIIKLNEKLFSTAPTAEGSVSPGTPDPSAFGSGSHVVYVDQDTKNSLDEIGIDVNTFSGYINGYTTNDNENHIRVDQGLDTDEISPAFNIDPELKETQYIVEMDSRLLRIYDIKSETKALAAPSFIDDDLIASYYLTKTAGSYISDMLPGNTDVDGVTELGEDNIQGPRGTKLRLGLLAATDVVSSDFLFNTIGTQPGDTDGTNPFAFIDTNIRITGVTTGYKIDIPVRVLKIID